MKHVLTGIALLLGSVAAVSCYVCCCVNIRVSFFVCADASIGPCTPTHTYTPTPFPLHRSTRPQAKHVSPTLCLQRHAHLQGMRPTLCSLLKPEGQVPCSVVVVVVVSAAHPQVRAPLGQEQGRRARLQIRRPPTCKGSNSKQDQQRPKPL